MVLDYDVESDEGLDLNEPERLALFAEIGDEEGGIYLETYLDQFMGEEEFLLVAAKRLRVTMDDLYLKRFLPEVYQNGWELVLLKTSSSLVGNTVVSALLSAEGRVFVMKCQGYVGPCYGTTRDVLGSLRIQ